MQVQPEDATRELNRIADAARQAGDPELAARAFSLLGVVQLDGRYLLFPMALVLEAEQVFAPAVALKVDPNAPPSDDPYSDPAYQVPDDLVW